jgi:hypothetical protein
VNCSGIRIRTCILMYMYMYLLCLLRFDRWIDTIGGQHDRCYRSIVSVSIHRSIADYAQLCLLSAKKKVWPCDRVTASVQNEPLPWIYIVSFYTDKVFIIRSYKLNILYGIMLKCLLYGEERRGSPSEDKKEKEDMLPFFQFS